MAPTTAKLKHDINRGRAGDKVDAIDPAAAPLGTDDEAAGTPPSPAAVAIAHHNEVRSSPVTSERKDSDHGVAIYLCFVALVVANVILAIWLA
jgi:acetyl esterase/lipase